MRPSRWAFSLVELLVVITIIVVLLALLAPALDKAISRGAAVVCASNTRLWSLATRGYTLDYKGKLLYLLNSGSPSYWQYELASYMGQPSFVKNTTGNYLRANICPEVKIVPPNRSSNPASGMFGTAHQTWTMLGTTDPGSYGINCWVTNYPTYANVARIPPENYFHGYNDASGDVALFGDSMWVGTWPSHGDTPVPDPQYEYGDVTDAAGRYLGRYLINRHGMAINLSYIDGSASRVNLGDLWAQRWHRNSMPDYSHRGDFPE